MKAKLIAYYPEEVMLLAGLERAFHMARAEATRRFSERQEAAQTRDTEDEIYREELKRIKVVQFANGLVAEDAATPATAAPPAVAEPAPKKRGRKAAEPAAPVQDSTDAAQQELLANHGIPNEKPAPKVAEVTVVGQRPLPPSAEVFPPAEGVQDAVKAAYERLVAKGTGQGAAINQVRGVLQEFGVSKGSEVAEKDRATVIAHLGQVGA